MSRAVHPSLDAATISAAGAMVRAAIAASHLASAASEVREDALALGVARIMAAGAFARDGKLFLNSDVATPLRAD